MINREKEFLFLAKKMNEQLAIIPLLFGSVALNMLVDDEVEMGDLDIALPHFMRPDRKYLCLEFIKFMENNDYKYIDLHEGEFHKGEILIHTAGDSWFKEYADIDATECPIMQSNGAVYKIFTLEHQVKAYSVSAREREDEGEKNYHKTKKECE
jgi:hypothetical protein